MRSSYALVAMLVSSTLACTPSDPPADYGDPTNLATATTQSGITVQVFSPRATEVLDEPVADIELAAYTDPPRAVEVVVASPDGVLHAATVIGVPGSSQRFRVSVPLLHGPNALEIRVRRVDSPENRRLSFLATYEGSAPGLRFGFSDDRTGTACATALTSDVTGRPTVCVRGSVSGDVASEVDVVVSAMSTPATVTRTDGGLGFEALVPIAPDASTPITVVATRSASSSTSVSRTVVQDSTPPTLTCAVASTPALRTSLYSLVIDGTAFDAHGLASLRLENDAGGVIALPIADRYAKSVYLEPGENGFEVVAEDVAGNVARVPFGIVRERTIRLGAPDPNATVTLDLDEDALSDLLDLTAQKETEVVRISLRTAVLQALYAIREPELFEVDTSGWGQAEWNLHDLLNMTPDDANLAGSSIAELLDIAPAVGLPSPRVLAELLAITPTDTFLSLEGVVDVVLKQVIATHPNRCGEPSVTAGACIAFDAQGNPLLSLTMWDVLNDLATVDGRFGPSGAHPGFLVGALHSVVFEPGFQMSIPATSNLDAFQGVDAARGNKDFFFVPRPGVAAVLELDFLSDDFSVVGLVDEPTVDMRFILNESASFYAVSTSPAGKTSGADASSPGFYRGNSPVWAAQPWLVERVVAESAYRQYRGLFAASNYLRTLSYDAGSIDDAAVMNWDRGWVTITTSGDIGNPPDPTYLWDVLTEVAQLRLHEGGIPEGDADLAFLLENLPIGLDAAGLIDALRPTLSDQAAELANRLVSADGLVASDVDLYFVPGPSASPGSPGFLFFRAPGDASGPYTYVRTGFYSDAALTTKVSTQGAIGGSADTTHEKLVVGAGAHYFFADDANLVYELTIVTVDATGVEVLISPVVGGTP